jgi:uncharacterized protein (DUF736 family)
MSELVPIGALWKGKDKNGNSYLSGRMGDARLWVFSNQKEKDSQPDYRVFVSKPQKRDEEEDVPF